MRKCKPILFLAFIIFVFGSCRNAGKKLTGNEIIENTKSLNEYVMQDIKAAMVVATENEGQVDDTIRLSHFNAVEDFYYNRDYTPVWSDTGVFKPVANQFLSYLDTIIYEGLMKEDYHYSQISSSRKVLQTDSIKIKDAISWAKADILLTDAFLHIMNDLKQGKMVPDSLSWKNDTARFNNFFAPGLDSFLKGNPISSVMDSLHPGIASYKKLRKLLPDFLRKIDTTYYTALSYTDKFKSETDSLDYIKKLLQRLSESGKLKWKEEELPDSASLAKIISSFQQKHKIGSDGKISKSFFRYLNNTDSQKLKRILVSLDKYRLLPDSMPQTYIWVNLPSYYLSIKDSDTVVLRSKIVCGKPETRTPTLKSAVTDMVIYPTWTVPSSIIKKEMLPALKKNNQYLKKKGLKLFKNTGEEVDPVTIDWKKYNKGIPYQIKQGSGDDNALGVIKFNFFNPYDVYMHDTNQRGFFSRTIRALSHGCVRVQDWKELAYFIASYDSTRLKQGDSLNYNRDSIDNWIADKLKHRVLLKNRIPVFIQYISCEAGNEAIIFHDDMYDEDQELASKYFSGK